MKITEMNKEPKPITFADIKVGDVFKIHGDEKYYMKTEKKFFDIYDPFCDNFLEDYRNTVCLSNGKIIKVNEKTEVIPVDCELIIK